MAIATSLVIAPPEHVLSVKERLAGAEAISVVSEAELLVVQESLLARPPEIVVMHPTFAATGRGASLVTALKARPCESGTSIRVFLENDGDAPLILPEEGKAPGDALLEASRPLDRAGTRQAARYPMRHQTVSVNGEEADLIDLSVSGAQIESSSRLRPLKVAKLVIEGQVDLYLRGQLAWAMAVPGGGGIRYRAGVEFLNPDKKRLATFCAKHGGAPDPTLGKS